MLLSDLKANVLTNFANTEKHYTAHHHTLGRFLWKKSFYLCVIVNIHYIDGSVTVTYKKISVFFRLQDFQEVYIGTTINKNKVLELQSKAEKKPRSSSLKLPGNMENWKYIHKSYRAFIIAKTCVHFLIFDVSEVEIFLRQST